MGEKGLVYVATGEKYVREAEISAASAKRIMPDIFTAIFTPDLQYRSDLFDHVLPVENYSNTFSDKIEPLLSTPFSKSIFIDSDTYFCDDIRDVFELLDRFDLAVAHAFDRRPAKVPVPNCFPELNTGVIAFVKSSEMNELFRQWKVLYNVYRDSRAQVVNDQASFRKVLYESNLRFYILPPEYNMRPQFPAIAGRGETMKILHTRDIDHEEWCNKINSNPSLQLRVTIPSWIDFMEGRLIVMHKSLVQQAIILLLKLARTISKLINYK